MIDVYNHKYWYRAKRRRILALGSFLVIAPLLTFAPFAYAQQTARGKALGKRVKCMCGGCNDSATLCNHMGGSFSGPCDVALGMQKEIDQRLARNESDDLTLQAFVQEYGPTVLIEPPTKGFNLTAWVMPVVVPIISFVLVWALVRRWRQKAALVSAAGPGISADFLLRAQREASKEYDE